jgi:C-terminal processing protease CtpA/Prc
LPGGGASDAGLLAGDTVLAIDGVAVINLGSSRAVEALRGPENSIVMLTVKRADAAPFVVPVRRKHVELR